MVSQAITAAPADARTRRYRDAEEALWEHHGLKPTERFIDLASPRVRIRVQEVGSGKPILFIPGTAGTGPVWGGLVRELQGFRCIMLDRPGWGLSSPIDYSRHAYRTLAGQLLGGVLDALGIERAHVAGASIGGAWALSLAARDSARVRSIILLGGGPLVPEIQPPPFVRMLASPIGALIVRLPQKPDRVRSILRGLGHGPSLDAGRIPDAFIDWRVVFERQTGAMRQERNMVRALVAGGAFRAGLTFSDAELATIPHPTLMVYGTADPVGTVPAWRRAMEAMPGGRLSLVNEAGHVPWFDAPSEVAQTIVGFLGEVDGG